MTSHHPGTRLTQGAAIGGLGRLLDAAENDRYISHGFAIGFGGPLGVGDDTINAATPNPSAYNALDAPTGKPGDPL